MGSEQQVPLLNAQLEMNEREQINDALTTGLRVRAVPSGHPAECNLPPLSTGRLSWRCGELCTSPAPSSAGSTSDSTAVHGSPLRACGG